MSITTISSRELNHDLGKAKRAAAKGPVFITDRGRPQLVILNIDEYQRITETQQKIADLLSTPEVADLDFAAPKLNINFKPADLS